jgi:hypothetical protein
MNQTRKLLTYTVVLSAVVLPALSQPLTQPPNEGQVVTNESGGMFMEEIVEPKKPAARTDESPYGLRKPRGGQDLPLDLGTVGVKVDPHGKIVPLLQNGSPPGRLQPTFSETTVTRETPYPYYYGPNAGVGWGAPIMTYAANPYGYGPVPRPYYPGWGNGWNPYWNGQQYPAWQYVTPRGISPIYSPSGAVPYTGSVFNNPPAQTSGIGFSSKRGSLWLPNVIEYQSTSTIRPLFSGPVGP